MQHSKNKVSHVPPLLPIENRRIEEREEVPRNSLLSLSFPLLVVSSVVMDRELGVGGVAADGAIGHREWDGNGFGDGGRIDGGLGWR